MTTHRKRKNNSSFEHTPSKGLGQQILNGMCTNSDHIVEFIKRRRLQLLVSSASYYELNDSYVSDDVWQQWANELKQVQELYPYLLDDVRLPHNEHFVDWDGDSGYHIPYRLYIRHAEYILGVCENENY